jgi:hypothetical protein
VRRSSDDPDNGHGQGHGDGATKPDASRPQPSHSSPEPSFPAAVRTVADAIRRSHPTLSDAEAVAHVRDTMTMDGVAALDGSDLAIAHIMACYRLVLTLRYTPVAEPDEVYVTTCLDPDCPDVFPARVVPTHGDGLVPYFRRDVVDAMCAWICDWYERTLPYVDEGELDLIRWASGTRDVVELYDARTEQRTELIAPVPSGPLRGRYPIGAGRWPWTTVEQLPSRDLPETRGESPSGMGDDGDGREPDRGAAQETTGSHED